MKYRRSVQMKNFALLVLVANFSMSSVLAKVTLVEDGEPRAAVVVAEDVGEWELGDWMPSSELVRFHYSRDDLSSAQREQEAADILVGYLRKISGAQLPVVVANEELPAGMLPIYIGDAADEDLAARILEKGDDPESFILQTDDSAVHIRGLERGAGTRHGVFELLEQLGCRWFAPGELHTVIPEKTTLTIAEQEEIQVPSFKMRGTIFSRGSPEWYIANRTSEYSRPVGRHGMPPLGRFDEDNKELYGVDQEGEYYGRRGVYNLGNPDTLEAVVDHIVKKFEENPEMEHYVFSAGTHDHGDIDHSPESMALDGGDWDPYAGFMSQTDRWVWFYNKVLERFDEELPDKELEIAFYAYGNKQLPPVRWEADPRLAPAIAPIHFCRRHSPVNPECTDKHAVQGIVEGWAEFGVDIYHRGFWWNLACVGAPFPIWSRLSEEIPWCYEQGVRGYNTQADTNWGADMPSLYVAYKLMWDHEADVDVLLDDFAEKYFGPAAQPMREYLRLLDNANNNADHHTGSSWDFPHIYTPELREHAYRLLDEADRLLATVGEDEDSLYTRRVRMTRKIMDYTDAFCRMMDRRNEQDWQSAYAALQDMKRLHEVLTERYDPPAIFEEGGGGQSASTFIKMFGNPIEDAYERTVNGNRFVAGLSTKWDFLLDRHRVGEDLGYYRQEDIGGNWNSYDTRYSWSDHGLHQYLGEAWYRQSIEIPEEFDGERMFMWFGGVHNQAKVWVNGEHVGNSHTSAFRPFEFDVTEAVRPGQNNQVAIRVSSVRVREVGAGGLVAPAFFYVPAEGEDAEPAYSLSDEFPLEARDIHVPEGHIP